MQHETLNFNLKMKPNLSIGRSKGVSSVPFGPFFSFSCSFWEKLVKIISCSRLHVWGCRPQEILETPILTLLIVHRRILKVILDVTKSIISWLNTTRVNGVNEVLSPCKKPALHYSNVSIVLLLYLTWNTKAILSGCGPTPLTNLVFLKSSRAV